MGIQTNLTGSCSLDEQPNPLLTKLFESLPFPRKHKPKEKRTTVIIGIRHNDGIVIASDSKVSRPDINRTDRLKLSEVKIDSDGIAVVGGAGTMAFTEETVDIIRDKLRDGVKDSRELADCCREAHSYVWKHEVVDKVRALGLSGKSVAPDMLADYIREMSELLGFAVLVGGKIGSGPEFCLFKVLTGRLGTVVERAVNYDAIGVGETVALYILGHYWTKEMSSGFYSISECQMLALYTIDQVTEVVPGCGKPTHVWTITRNGVSRMTEQEMDKMRESYEIDLEIRRSFRLEDKKKERQK